MAVGLAASPAIAQVAPPPEPECSAVGAEDRTFSEVVDGGSLRLAGGEIVLLAGIDVPRGLAGETGEALAASRAQLKQLAGAAGTIRLIASGRDRHGRLLVQAFDASGRLLQAGMVASGFARVRPYPHAIPCLGHLLQLEQEARQAKRALWNNDFAPLAANDPSLLGRKGLYTAVEGFVLSVGRGNRVDFLNFGRFWQRDFTVLVSAAVRAKLAEAGLDTAMLAERRVLVRGVVEESGGPTIRLNDFRELEILDDD
jgi:endonuclease YncB( thermonuclease family)